VSARELEPELERLDARVAERARAMRAVRPDWPCRRGCDACCRQLDHAPELTAAEWARVDAAVAALEPEARAAVERRIDRVLEQGDASRVACPYLDEAAGACRIYEARPLACRTYGFFVARDAPEVCSIIDADVAARGERGLVWGNATSFALEREARLGAAIPFATHYSSRGESPRCPP